MSTHRLAYDDDYDTYREGDVYDYNNYDEEEKEEEYEDEYYDYDYENRG